MKLLKYTIFSTLRQAQPEKKRLIWIVGVFGLFTPTRAKSKHSLAELILVRKKSSHFMSLLSNNVYPPIVIVVAVLVEVAVNVGSVIVWVILVNDVVVGVIVGYLGIP